MILCEEKKFVGKLEKKTCFPFFVTPRCICVDDLDTLVYPLLCCSPKNTALFGASDQSRNCFLGPADSPRSFIEERPCSLFARL